MDLAFQPHQTFQHRSGGQPFRPAFAASAAYSRFDKRASIPSISIAFLACPKTQSAARNQVDGDVLVSSMILSIVVAAAADPCCNRARACPNAARLALL